MLKIHGKQTQIVDYIEIKKLKNAIMPLATTVKYVTLRMLLCHDVFLIIAKTELKWLLQRIALQKRTFLDIIQINIH